MIQREKLLAQLQSKKGRFLEFDASVRDETRLYDEALVKLGKTPAAEILERISDDPSPGAFPSPEIETADNFRLRFPTGFAHHQQAREWALEVLLDHTVFAVDGSQISPSKDFNIPVAAVQVACFVNHHTRDGRYEKEAAFEILSPEELLIEQNGDRQVSEQMVNARRFELEAATLRQCMERPGAAAGLPLALFDSSLVISFADRLQGEMRDRHLKAMIGLLDCAKRTGTPLVGYVDSSDARDLTRMLECCFQLPKAERIHDAQIVAGRLEWGDRTPFLKCARRGADLNRESVLEVLEKNGHEIGFLYLKMSASAPPVRLDFPMWVAEQELLNQVVDLTRAEAIVGNGYPYAIEAADAAAVITTRDRDAFFAIFQRFIADQGFQLRVAQKATSKTRRR
jgi:hypothetical protein